MPPLVIALVSFAVAFISGWTLSKVYFRIRAVAADTSKQDLHNLLRAQRSRYRRKVQVLHDQVRKHESTRGAIRQKLEKLQPALDAKTRALAAADSDLEDKKQTLTRLERALADRDAKLDELKSDSRDLELQLKSERAKAQSADNELGLLRIERDELSAQTHRFESKQAAEQQLSEKENVSSRAEVGELKESLTARDYQIRELEMRVAEGAKQIGTLQSKLDSWRSRIKPLTDKLRQRNLLIKELLQSGLAASEFTPANVDPGNKDSADDLKEICGIGPALERRLNVQGIERFRQIAEMSDADIEELALKLAISPSLVVRHGWIKQAQELYQRKYAFNA